jgi:anti-sigma B factor antagonist
MAADCDCRLERLSGSLAVVKACGELDVHTCPAFKKAVEAAGGRADAHLVVDLSEVTFMDSTALGVLAAEQRHRPERLHLVVQQEHLLRLFEVTGLIHVFALHASLDEALLRTGHLAA